MEFITFLREHVCVNHQKDLFFRGWDNWPSSAAGYEKMSDQIPVRHFTVFCFVSLASFLCVF